MINKLIISQRWNNTDSYPSHFEYRINVYRDNVFACTGQVCESKPETVAYIVGLTQAFRIYGDSYEIEYVDAEGKSSDYFKYFMSSN